MQQGCMENVTKTCTVFMKVVKTTLTSVDSDSDSELEENVQDPPLSLSQISRQEIANTLK